MATGAAPDLLPAHLALLWGKLGPKEANPRPYHPLICHMLDVAAVAEVMWREVLAPATRRRLAEALGLPEEEAGKWIAFFAGLHDLGKASPGFALQDREAAARLRACGYEPSPLSFKPPHGVVTASTLVAALHDLSLAGELVGPAARILGGHHGVFPRSGDLRLPALACGVRRWSKARPALVRSLANALRIGGAAPRGRLDPSTAMILGGLVTVADWIGSAERFFPYVAVGSSAPRLNVNSYAEEADRKASKALGALGWLPGTQRRDSLTFRQLFPTFAGTPRQVQVLAEELAGKLRPPCLVLIEAPTGEGKTEAGMYLADRWGGQGYPGIYFALPTMATSNQMFTRVREFLAYRYAGESLNLQLLHGHAALSAEFRLLRQDADSLLRPSGVLGEPGYDGAPAGVVAAEWFTHRKRGLLAPFGVGTVDQALLSVLQTRHSFVRLFGLAGKTVIVDEAHAYETYTTTLLQCLLEWLAALGSPVVVLSATLPAEKRRALLKAYARGLGRPDLDASVLHVGYPRLTWLDSGEIGELRAEPSPLARRQVQVDWVDGTVPAEGEPFPLGERLRVALKDGGCAAVICNTVGKAQQIYRALKPYFPGEVNGEPELDLFHARYLFRERDAREKRALLRFGKPGARIDIGADGERVVSRPFRAVLVATQVVEQSLDLDFDLMVSEVAPVDLVLQRLGRLWRHDRGPARHSLVRPALWLLRPEIDGDGVPRFGRGTERVYEPYLLLRTWLTLKDRDRICLPGEVEPLVQAVYGQAPCPYDEGEPLAVRWRETETALSKRIREEEMRGLVATTLPPHYALDDVLEDYNRCLEEDDPQIHSSIQALTRLGPPSIRAVILFADEAALADIGNPPDLGRVEALLLRAVEISHVAVVPQLVVDAPPASWSRAALLRHLRLVQLGPDGSKRLGDYALRVDPELGLTITRSSKEEG